MAHKEDRTLRAGLTPAPRTPREVDTDHKRVRRRDLRRLGDVLSARCIVGGERPCKICAQRRFECDGCPGKQRAVRSEGVRELSIGVSIAADECDEGIGIGE